MADLDNIIELTGEDGTPIRCEFLDLIPYRGNEYVVLLPVDDDDGQVVILQVDSDPNSDEESYLEVDDDSIVQAVYQIFKENNKEYFDFSEDQTQTAGGKKWKCRSRLALLFVAWIGAWAGLHLNFIGFRDVAADFRRRMGGLFCIINPVCWLMHIIEVFKVLFGGYRTDAYGRPIRYLPFLYKKK